MFIIKNYEDEGKQPYYCYQKDSKCTKDIIAKQILSVYKGFLKDCKFILNKTLILLDQSMTNKFKSVVNKLKRVGFNYLYLPK